MNNNTLRLKFKQRLNKLSSNDYDNIENWQIVESFNKAQIEWVRRMLHGNNIYKEGDEQSKRRIDDLQILLKQFNISGVDKIKYFESTNFPPTNYMEYKRVSTNAKDNCCPKPRSMTVYLVEEANVDMYFRDPLKKPDFSWGETFCTLIDNKIRIYKDGFDIVKPTLTYYRQPVNIEIKNTLNPYTGNTSLNDVECEFKDDIVEIILDEAVSILAGDQENITQYQRTQKNSERNN